MANLLPAIFFGHGNPMNAVLTNAYTYAWRGVSILPPCYLRKILDRCRIFGARKPRKILPGHRGTRLVCVARPARCRCRRPFGDVHVSACDSYSVEWEKKADMESA